jgi:hypothetical protein
MFWALLAIIIRHSQRYKGTTLHMFERKGYGYYESVYDTAVTA